MTPIIKFEFTDEAGEKFVQESPLWDDEIEQISNIGVALNQFLRLLSYVRKNDYIFMEDITEEEHAYLADRLHNYRNGIFDDDVDEEQDYEEMD